MRLATKVFLTESVAILALVGVSVGSLVVVNRLVVANRSVATRTVPALQFEAALAEQAQSLTRLQMRHTILPDPVYAALREARAAEIAQSLERLRPFLLTPGERRLHDKIDAALVRYRTLAAEPDAPPAATRGGTRRRAAAPRRTAAQLAVGAAGRIERSVHRLMADTGAAAAAAQRQALELERRTWRGIALILAASLLAGLLGAALLAWRMGRSLGRIATASAQVAQGSFRGPVAVYTRDEIGDLARAFDRMAERLGDVERLKEELLAHVSHELRTPLTSVREATHLLRDRVAGALDPRQERLVEIIGASTDRVLRMVNRILDLSRLRAGLSPLARRWVDLDTIAERVMVELRPEAEARGVRLETARNGRERAAVGMWGDEERLLEVLVNLVSNAVKATPAGGSVRVGVSGGRGDAAELVVEDTGSGIPGEALQRIFEPYWQAPGAQGGSGLGLAIVKGIVEAHGGTVRAESERGRGSRFTVSLPRGEAAR